MTSSQIVAAVAAAGAVVGTGLIAAGVTVPERHRWKIPATLSALFAALSLRAIVSQGLFGFWTDHTRNAWGNQIFLDLLLAASIGWFLIVPQARALGMRLVPWLVAILCTGSIAFLAMLARLLYLRDRSAAPASV